ncbi:cobalamin biosynthesis protein [Actinocorallia sp. API 0066]|uniref:cobalamin biosynthesis protein n=1 Tax=Actinocorallia sp. API 0066 TaxID=2896846 RepID=UPI0035AC1A27
MSTGVTARAAGLLLGAGLDALLGDPRRGHPVAGFGRAAAGLERAVYADDRARGVLFTGACVGGALALGALAERAGRGRPVVRCLTTAAATWTVLGGASLAREGEIMARHLESGQVGAARVRLSHLCARDPSTLDDKGLARATVESLAENTGDAVVSPLFWGAVAGVPGLLAYRAVNTLDAMVGYRSPRYVNFGWASARLDDAANWIPARLTGALTVLAAPVTGRAGAVADAWRVLRRDGAHHPSPNAGRCEAAAAGALGVSLGGANTYGDTVEARPVLGDGPVPDIPDIRRAVRLTRAVSGAAVAAGVLLALGLGAARKGPR